VLDERLSRVLLESDVNELVFSVDAHTSDVYERIRLGGKFEIVRDNIIKFHELRDRYYPNSNLRTRVSGMLFDPEQNQEEFEAFWTKIADAVGYAFIRPQWDTYNNDVHPENNEACHNLWGRLYVWWDGTINPCEQDYKSTLSVGTFPKSSIRDLWQSDGMKDLRQRHATGGRSKCFPCDRCGWSSGV
jgi:radical SAM protein with 4Fe4S-binding SPASM domain